MELIEFGPDDAARVRAYTDVTNAVTAVDAAWLPQVTPFRTEMDMRHGWDGELGRYFLATDGAAGGVVGVARLDTSEWDNLDMAWLDFAVAPEHRRRGHGSDLLRLLVEQAHWMGRHLVSVSAWESDGVRAFAAAHDFSLRAQEIARRMTLAGLDLAAIRALRDDAASEAADYELVRVVGSTPDNLLDAVAQMTAAINDAPTDDLELEDEVYPPQRVRDYEEHSAASGWRLYRLIARHRTTGELAGHTVVQVDERYDEPGHQHDTSVVGAHRGHRLGLLLKAEMALWLADVEPRVEVVDTWNAESNRHMIAVNEQLGYVVMDRMLNFQRRFPD